MNSLFERLRNGAAGIGREVGRRARNVGRAITRPGSSLGQRIREAGRAVRGDASPQLA